MTEEDTPPSVAVPTKDTPQSLAPAAHVRVPVIQGRVRPEMETEVRVPDTDHPPPVEKVTEPGESRERERPPRLNAMVEMVPLPVAVPVEAV